MKKRDRNLISLILGIVLILIGLIGTVYFLPSPKLIIILPVLALIIGSILAILGGLEKW